MSINNVFNQGFNYHTHTYRSGHSEYIEDIEMLEATKKAGIKQLGFSEHIPNPEIIYPTENDRMLSSEKKEYIESIKDLKENNPDMTILVGFEAEYDPLRISYLKELREEADYMLLGQHFITDGIKVVNANNNPNYPIQYAESVISALETGLFDILVHPDYFMIYMDKQETEEAKELFIMNAKKASRMICEKAKELNIPVEINLTHTRTNSRNSDGNLMYPHPIFWEEAKKVEGLKVIKGMDAHTRNSFEDTEEKEKLIKNIIDMVSDKLLTDYNPKEARQENELLNNLYEKTKQNNNSFGTILITYILEEKLSDYEKTDKENIYDIMNKILDYYEKTLINQAREKEEEIISEIDTITNSKKAKRKRMTIIEIKQVLNNQLNLLKQTRNSLKYAKELGCETKEEYLKIVTYLLENEGFNTGTIERIDIKTF